jgi:DNA-binding MarR family transcriptional regulator
MRFTLTGSGAVTVTEDMGDGLVAQYRLEPRRGSLVVVGLEVLDEADDAPGITAAALRRLSPARAVREGLRGLRSIDANSRGDGRGWGRMMEAMAQGAPWSDSALWRRVTTEDGARRFLRDPRRLPLVALAYVVSLDAGETRVNVAIAERFGIETGQARELVRAARREGLLEYSPAPEGERRGRVGGGLTPEGVKLLQKMYMAWLAARPDAGQIVITMPEAPEDDEGTVEGQAWEDAGRPGGTLKAWRTARRDESRI